MDDDAESSTLGPQCGHCRRCSLHPKLGRSNCTLKKLSATQAHDVLKDFEVNELLAVAPAAAKAFNTAITNNVDADISAILADERSQFGGRI
jgi:hypothetical protein